MKLSVIICTYNPREEYLRRVLAALRRQTLAMEYWELLLVDNCSSLPLANRFDISWHSNARHIREEELGLTSARVRAIRESAADILVFVDDDTALSADYLEQALTVASQWPFVGIWGGNCTHEYEVPLPAWVGDQVWRLLCVEVKEDVWSNLREGFTTMPAGAGMCVRRNVCLHFLARYSSGNSRALGRKGTGLSGYEDIEMGHCALDLGLGTGKSKRLFLTHLVPATRLTLDYFLRHAESDAASFILFRAIRNLPIQKPKPSNFITFLRWFIHRIIHRVPREQYLIQKAYLRGLHKGWELAQTYLKSKTGPLTK